MKQRFTITPCNGVTPIREWDLLPTTIERATLHANNALRTFETATHVLIAVQRTGVVVSTVTR